MLWGRMFKSPLECFCRLSPVARRLNEDPVTGGAHRYRTKAPRAQLRLLVKRILRKYRYPPDNQEKATMTVLERGEVPSAGWAT